MGHPTGGQKAEIDPMFEDRINELEKKAKNFSEHFRNHSKYREWHTPKGVKDPLDVPSIHNPTWVRNNLNIKYSEEIVGKSGNDAGSFGDAMATKWQIDFMAVEERAFRTRHASFVRCASHAHGRLDGHGRIKKGVFTFIKDGVQSAIDYGSKGS